MDILNLISKYVMTDFRLSSEKTVTAVLRDRHWKKGHSFLTLSWWERRPMHELIDSGPDLLQVFICVLYLSFFFQLSLS